MNLCGSTPLVLYQNLNAFSYLKKLLFEKTIRRLKQITSVLLITENNPVLQKLLLFFFEGVLMFTVPLKSSFAYLSSVLTLSL